MKILSLTSIRSDYDLMSPLYRELSRNKSFELGIIVAGAHQSDFHNYSARNIANDGLNIVTNVFNFANHDEYIGQVQSGAKLLEIGRAHV